MIANPQKSRIQEKTMIGFSLKMQWKITLLFSLIIIDMPLMISDVQISVDLYIYDLEIVLLT